MYNENYSVIIVMFLDYENDLSHLLAFKWSIRVTSPDLSSNDLSFIKFMYHDFWELFKYSTQHYNKPNDKWEVHFYKQSDRATFISYCKPEENYWSLNTNLGCFHIHLED